jgi:hypothetical protein
MSVNYNTSIVTNGLITCLDAGNPKSYPGSGSTWYDLSGNNNHATIHNLTYTSTYKGSFNFSNDTSSYVTLSNNINYENLGASQNFTIMSGIQKLYYGLYGNNYGDSSIMLGSVTGYTYGWRIIESSGGTPGAAFTSTHHLTFSAPSLLPNSSSANNLFMTDSVSTNRPVIFGVSQARNNVFGMINNNFYSTNGFTSYLGTGTAASVGVISNTNYGIGAFGGLMTFLHIYNRGLTNDELVQNYNAMRGRHGV